MSPLTIFIIEEAFKYGPDMFTKVMAALKKPGVTVSEIDSMFQGVKPYDYYKIPDVVPVPAATTVNITV